MKIRQIFRKKWLITWILLFSLSFITPPVIAQITTGIEAAKEGANYYQLQDYQKAVEYWQEAADKFSQAGDKTNQVIALSNLSLTYQKISEWDEAKTTIDKSLEILANQPETLENQNLLAQTIDIRGKYYQNKGEYENALEIWQKSADIYT
ncbi:MAG: tetratricopeptide repeat protein, partial [Cyanobacteria bacterium J083]